jgi:polyhydroxybutyrate depolymerase
MGNWNILLGALTAITIASAMAERSRAAAEPLKLTHQGIERSATLYRPAMGPIGPRPLVIALHGRGQSVQQLREGAGCCGLPFDTLADREGFVVLYPQAVGLLWSYGRPIVAPMPVAGSEPVDDVEFIRGLIDGLIAKQIADPTRIYVTGVSRGGLMAFTLACALSDRVAAAAPLITGMSNHQRDDCKPAHPIPILVIAGTNDPTQWYDGALAPLGRLLSVPETMEFWRTQHGCTGQNARLLPDRDRSDRTRVMRVDWIGCKGDAPLTLFRVQGGGHQVPSFQPSNDQTVKRFGLRNGDIEAVEEIWRFFKPISR